MSDQPAAPYAMRPVAHARSDFPAKFGIPRQAGLVPQLRARIVFEPEFRSPDAVRGLEDFSFIWLVWAFSENAGRWSPTVRSACTRWRTGGRHPVHCHRPGADGPRGGGATGTGVTS